MTDAPLILGFDTSAAHCAAALVRGDDILAAVGEEMARGQAERLMDLLQEVLAQQSVGWRDLSALAVGTGPGNFTGIRIGVSAARGLALGLGCPAYGVTGFEARAHLAPDGTSIAIPAPRERAYVIGPEGPTVVARDVISSPAPEPSPDALAIAIAQHAQSLFPAKAPAPTPFYLRPPDAAPARDTGPTILP